MAGELLPAVLIGAGDAGIDEMRPFVQETQVQWALLRFELGEGSFKRQKVLFVHINSDGCPALARGRANQLTGDVKSVLRGEGGQDAIHASVEVKRRDELRAEVLLERVARYFITDSGAEYSVQWMLKEYERQLQTSSKSFEKTAADGSDASPSGRRVPGHQSHIIFTTGRDALKVVGEPLGPWNWVMLMADPEALHLVDGGDDSIDGMQRCITSRTDLVMMGLLRMGFGEGRLRRTKYVFVHANGSGVSAVARGRLGACRSKMQDALGRYATISVAVEINDPQDLSLEDIIERVRRAAIIDDDVVEKDEATKSIFSVEAFRQALAEEQVVTASFREEEEDGEVAPAPGSQYSVEEAVRLIRCQDSTLNWVLFGPNLEFARRRKSSQAPPHVVWGVVPSGGYMAAKKRATSVGVAPVNAQALVEEEEEEAQAEAAAAGPPGRVSTRGGNARGRGRSALPLGSGKSMPSDAQPVPALPGRSSRGALSPRRSPVGDSQGSPASATPVDPARGHSSASVVPTHSLPAQQKPAPPAPSPKASGGYPSAGGEQSPTKDRPRLAGPLLKQSGAWLRGWQLRWFEVGSGVLSWWDSPEEAAKGGPPKGLQPLVGMKVKMLGGGSPSQFTLETAGGKDKVYCFDANAAQYVAKAGWGMRAAASTVTTTAADWIKALEQEAIMRRRTMAAGLTDQASEQEAPMRRRTVASGQAGQASSMS